MVNLSYVGVRLNSWERCSLSADVQNRGLDTCSEVGTLHQVRIDHTSGDYNEASTELREKLVRLEDQVADCQVLCYWSIMAVLACRSILELELIRAGFWPLCRVSVLHVPEA